MTRLASLAAVSAFALLGFTGVGMAEEVKSTGPQVLSLGQLDTVSAGNVNGPQNGCVVCRGALAYAGAWSEAEGRRYSKSDTYTETTTTSARRAKASTSYSSSYAAAR